MSDREDEPWSNRHERDDERVRREYRTRQDDQYKYFVDERAKSTAFSNVLLALFQAGFDPRSDDDMKRLSEHLRSVEEYRINYEKRRMSLVAGSITLGFTVIALLLGDIFGWFGHILTGKGN